MKIVIATHKSWNIENAEKMQEKYKNEHEIKLITQREELDSEMLEKFFPDYIFFPHWSYIIPAKVYERFNCVVFHMTDLPFGRGGSPLQNLIVRGMHETMLSAIKVVKNLDAGPVYLKKQLSLDGSAQEIFLRASTLIFEEMMPQFFCGTLTPIPQQGEPTFFKRRTPEQSELKDTLNLEQIYDYIRMLDAEGYPNAYIRMGKYKLTFQNASLEDNAVRASVTIMEDEV